MYVIHLAPFAFSRSLLLFEDLDRQFGLETLRRGGSSCQVGRIQNLYDIQILVNNASRCMVWSMDISKCFYKFQSQTFLFMYWTSKIERNQRLQTCKTCTQTLTLLVGNNCLTASKIIMKSYVTSTVR